MAVKALLHYALEVPDQGAGEKFYSNFGLIDAPGRDGAVRLRPAPLQRESVLLYGGPRKRLHHLAFVAPGNRLPALHHGPPQPRVPRSEGTRLPPRVVRGRQRGRDRDGRREDAGGGLAAGVGSRTSRHRLELLLLHPRPVGELRRVLPRPRLYSRALRVGAARLPRGGGALPLGAAGARGLRPGPP